MIQKEYGKNMRQQNDTNEADDAGELNDLEQMDYMNDLDRRRTERHQQIV